ncbi:hypothetical protein [Planctomycetes bacterium Pan216]|uniref:hypothetical protein n=1 Tax=Kolteria novifilia TaxID=2527975 RepID=UPI0011A26BAD
MRGNVAFGDEPIAEGELRFVPIKGTVAPVAGALIADGLYEVTNKGGVPVGTYRVEIMGYRELPKDPGDDLEIEAREQYVPAEFNERSNLEVVVEKGATSMRQDFQLTKP